MFARHLGIFSKPDLAMETGPNPNNAYSHDTFVHDTGSSLTRFTGAVLPAALISVSLLAFMQYLIAGTEFEPSIDRSVDLTKIVMEKEKDIEVKTGIVKPPVPLPPEVLPKPHPVGPTTPTKTGGIEWTAGPYVVPEPGPNPVASVDRGAYPRFRVQPQFPAQAPANGGCVVVGFTITATGSVANAAVLDTSSRKFNTNALKAVNQFKYEPWISNGRPMATPNQSIRLVFQYEGTNLPSHTACTG